MSAHLDRCPECGEEFNWDDTVHDFWPTPEQVPAAVDEESTPPVRPPGRRRTKRGGKKVKENERKRQAFSRIDESRPDPPSELPVTGATAASSVDTPPSSPTSASVPKAVAATILGATVLASQFTTGETVDPASLSAAAGAQGISAIGVVLTAFCCMLAHRGWQSADIVLDRLENKSVQVVEAAGDNLTKAIPILTGLCITLLIVFVQHQVTKYWYSWAEDKKTKALCDGQNLEGNFVAGTCCGKYSDKMSFI